jgi:hypothetical protein
MNKKTKTWMTLGLVAATAAVFSACLLPTGDGKGLDADGNVIPEVVVVPDTNLTLVFNQVFNATTGNKCANCHVGANPSGGLNLSTVANARAALFDGTNPRLTFKEPTIFPVYRIKPGSPDSSYLYQKITGVFSTPNKVSGDARMPNGGPYLSAEKIALVRRWIQLGAHTE